MILYVPVDESTIQMVLVQVRRVGELRAGSICSDDDARVDLLFMY